MVDSRQLKVEREVQTSANLPLLIRSRELAERQESITPPDRKPDPESSIGMNSRARYDSSNSIFELAPHIFCKCHLKNLGDVKVHWLQTHTAACCKCCI